jgi:integrase
MLFGEKERYQRIMVGVPDGVQVDLGLVRLPTGALMFPAPDSGEEFDFAKPCNARNFSKEFARRADLLGFGRTRFHDLRGIHTSALLDAGIPVHTVAQRIGRRIFEVLIRPWGQVGAKNNFVRASFLTSSLLTA